MAGAVCAALLIRREDFQRRDTTSPGGSGEAAGQEAAGQAR